MLWRSEIRQACRRRWWTYNFCGKLTWAMPPRRIMPSGVIMMKKAIGYLDEAAFRHADHASNDFFGSPKELPLNRGKLLRPELLADSPKAYNHDAVEHTHCEACAQVHDPCARDSDERK